MTHLTPLFSHPPTEVPVNFKAFSYLHLIDNLTGTDIDLLQTPYYTFEGKTTDYTSRFKLVFIANNANGNEGDDNFAFINNDEFIVLGEGTLRWSLRVEAD